MTMKYLDVASVIVNLAGWNISLIAAFYGTGYSVTYGPISISGHTFNGKVKKCLTLELIILGLNVFMMVMYFIAEVNHQGIAQVGAIWQHFRSQVAPAAVFVLIAALIISYLLVRTTQDTYSGEEIDRKYIDFTKEVGTNREMFIIAGDFGFLGRVPNNTVENFDHCAAMLKNLLKTGKPECNCSSNSEQCKNCVMKKEQFKQVVDKVKNKSVNLKILCRRPNMDEDDYKITMGYFMELFPRMKIRFYSGQNGRCPDLPLRGRIIETARNSKKMFSHFVMEPNQYQEMAVCDTDSPEGRTYIGIYSALWQAAADKTSLSQLNKYKALYKTYISKAEQEEHDQDCPG